jgi:hypothetical protein
VERATIAYYDVNSIEFIDWLGSVPRAVRQLPPAFAQRMLDSHRRRTISAGERQ